MVLFYILQCSGVHKFCGGGEQRNLKSPTRPVSQVGLRIQRMVDVLVDQICDGVTKLAKRCHPFTKQQSNDICNEDSLMSNNNICACNNDKLTAEPELTQPCNPLDASPMEKRTENKLEELDPTGKVRSCVVCGAVYDRFDLRNVHHLTMPTDDSTSPHERLERNKAADMSGKSPAVLTMRGPPKGGSKRSRDGAKRGS